MNNIIQPFPSQHHDYHNGKGYFQTLLNQSVMPDKYYNLPQKEDLSDFLKIPLDDIKMISIATDIIDMPQTVFGLERAFVFTMNITDDETVSSVQDILSQVSAETNPTSRAVSIVNDDMQRNWNLSATEIVPTDDESIDLQVCDYYDGEQGRVCGQPILEAETKCPMHRKPEFNQPMMMINHMQEIDPGRAYHLMKGLLVEIPKPNEDLQVCYANCVEGDTGSFLDSVERFRKLLKGAFEVFKKTEGRDHFKLFDSTPMTRQFSEFNYSEAKWYSIYRSLKEMLTQKHLCIDTPWVQHLFTITNKQGANQGFVNIERPQEQQIAEWEDIKYWPQIFSRSILDQKIFQVKEKVPHIYLIQNPHGLPPYQNKQRDGNLSQTGQYEKGFKHSERSQPIFGIFFDQRLLQYENPDHNVMPDNKILVVIQAEMQVDCQMDANRWGTFNDRLNTVNTDKMNKIQMQLQSITYKDGITVKNFNNLDALARAINDPSLKQSDLDKFLKQVNGSELSDSGFIANSTVEKLANQLKSNKKNHTTAHRNAKKRLDTKDMRETDRQYAAATHLSYIMSSTPKTTLKMIKLIKYGAQHNIDFMFLSSTPMTWSTHLRWIQGGFMQIHQEIMQHPALAEFRTDFGLDDPKLSNSPTIMDVLGREKITINIMHDFKKKKKIINKKKK